MNLSEEDLASPDSASRALATKQLRGVELKVSMDPFSVCTDLSGRRNVSVRTHLERRRPDRMQGTFRSVCVQTQLGE